MRLLGGVRQSVESEAGTSPEGQIHGIQQWSSMHGHTVIGMAVDLGVSAGVYSPWDRPELGPYLTDPELIDTWDVLVVYKIDRIFRSILDFAQMVIWLNEHGKTFACVAEPIDLTTPLGEALAGILVIFAQLELRNLTLRNQNTHATLKREGKWSGYAPQYGYMVQIDETGKNIVIDPDATIGLKILIQKFFMEYAYLRIAKELTEEGFISPQDLQDKHAGKTPKGTPWSDATVKRILTNPAILGYQVDGDHNIVRDEKTGMPRIIAPALIPRSQWDDIQREVEKRNRKGTGTHSTGETPYLHVVLCGICKRPMYEMKTGKKYTYYRCRTMGRPEWCGNAGIRSDAIEPFVDESLLSEVGLMDVPRKVITPAEDHTNDLNEVEKSMESLERDRYVGGLFKGEAGEARFRKMYAALEARRDSLAALPRTEQRVSYVGTGESFSAVWERSSRYERGALLRKFGVTAEVIMVPPGAEAFVRDGEVVYTAPEKIEPYCPRWPFLYASLGEIETIKDLMSQT